MLSVKLRSLMKSKTIFAGVLVFQCLFVLAVLLDIPVFRAILVSIYLAFIPGFILLRITDFKELGGLETFAHSVGLSLAFLMVAGLLMNELGLAFGITRPLTTLSFALVLNSALLIMGLLSSPTEGSGVESFGSRAIKYIKSVEKSPLVLLYLCLPFLSIAGSVWNNLYQDNSILLVMIGAIAVLFAVGLLMEKSLPPKLYPLVLLAIGVSLLLHRSLVSNYAQAQGSDIYGELRVFRVTLNNAQWGPLQGYLLNFRGYSRYNDMLSITILPTFISSLTNINPEQIMKILFPLFFSFVPLIMYRVWEKLFNPRTAFIATFFFMAEQTFYMEMLGLTRQMIAELFLGLLLLLVLNRDMNLRKRTGLFAILGLALIVSHYALSMIFMLLLLAGLSLSFLKSLQEHGSTRITLAMVLMFSVMMFSWYLFTANSATFDSILMFTDYIRKQLGDWLTPASRGATVLRGLGLEASPSIWNTVSRGFAYCIQLLIVVGFVGILTKRVKSDISKSYLVFVSTSMALLAALVVVPGFAATLNMTRFYHILLFSLAPIFVLGVEVVTGRVFKRKAKLASSVLVLIILVSYFLFQTNFVYEVVKSDSWSLPLSKYRMDALRLYAGYAYLDEQSITGAHWISENIDKRYSQVYADFQCMDGALNHEGIRLNYEIETLTNTSAILARPQFPNATVYFNRLNVIYGIVAGLGVGNWNATEIPYVSDLSVVYSNGACEIRK